MLNLVEVQKEAFLLVLETILETWILFEGGRVSLSFFEDTVVGLLLDYNTLALSIS